MSRAGVLAALFAARKERLLADLEALVVRESPSDEPARVSQLALWVAERLGRAGLAAACVPCEGRGDAVRVRFGEETGGTLLLGHLDTVWPAGTLADIPFSVEDGVAKGPGVFDMKAGIAVALAILEAAAKGDVTPAGGVSLVLTPDEEVGSGASSGLLVEEALRRDRVLVLEPSGDGGAAKVARKGTGLVRVRFGGIASHAGLEPEKGASALLEMARFALYADALADKPAGTSVVPTVAGSGKVTNVVPERAELTVDFRVWTKSEADRLMAGLRAYRPADPRVAVEIDGGSNRPPMESTEASLDLYRRAASLAHALGFELPAARVGGGSDGNLTAAAGVPTLDGLGPAGGGAHARAEHVLVDDLPRRAALVAGLLEGAAG
ncbi:MAG: M20 family metallopeptidase [Acidobacteria bacterium]|nr:M20 family metallopeptidase [Acidobacteriota bacterium]